MPFLFEKEPILVIEPSTQTSNPHEFKRTNIQIGFSWFNYLKPDYCACQIKWDLIRK